MSSRRESRPLVPRPHLHPLIVFEGDSITKMYIGNWSNYETMMTEKSEKILLRIESNTEC